MQTTSQNPDYTETPEEMLGEHPPIFADPFHEANEVVLECGIENPEPCESCG
tara:strand:+ start:422 stop:577 length:156 start_codon:yes stop_codon:yes gene_type:complete